MVFLLSNNVVFAHRNNRTFIGHGLMLDLCWIYIYYMLDLIAYKNTYIIYIISGKSDTHFASLLIWVA